MPDTVIYCPSRLIPLRACMLVFLLLILGFLSSYSWAQSSPEPEASYESLSKLLSHEAVRQKLVEQLRQIALEEKVVSDVDLVQAEPLLQEPGVPVITKGREVLQDFASSMAEDLSNSWQILVGLLKNDTQQFKQISIWKAALLNLFITLFGTGTIYILLRQLASIFYRRLNSWAQQVPSEEELAVIQQRLEKRELVRHGFFHRGAKLKSAPQSDPQEKQLLTQAEVEQAQQVQKQHKEALRRFSVRYTRLRKLVAVLSALCIDAGVVLTAAFMGYLLVIGMATLGSMATITLLSMQFLTAFVAVELFKVLSRGVFSAKYESLRLLPIDASSASFWSHWTAVVVTVVGYGLLVLVPVLQTVFSSSLANVVGAFLITVIYIYAISVLWSKRKSVSAAFIEQAEKADNTLMGMVLRISSKVWFWLALAYFTVLLVVTHADKQNALSFMTQASLKTILAVLMGSFLSLFLATLSTHRIHLSAQWNHELPLLEARLNSYVPAAFRLLSLLVVCGVALFVFDAWSLFDLQQWLSSAKGQSIINNTVRVLIVLIIAALSWIVLASMIEHRLASSGEKMPSGREKTLLLLFRNALGVIIFTLTALTILSQVGIDIAPLIAGAGVVGLAIGFGAQKLVQDVITGVFIQLENGMNQNDVVEVAGLFGVVEKMTIRSVVIRTLDGGYHLVPFSSIDCVANHTRDYGYHHGEYLISHKESIDEVILHLQAAFVDLKEDPEVKDAILDEISIPGVTSLGKDGATIRVLIKTAPGMQWAVQRSFNRLVKQHFDAAGIEIPYPQTVIHFGRDKEGNSALVDIQMVDAVAQAARAERNE